jgi:hypothetical protein
MKELDFVGLNWQWRDTPQSGGTSIAYFGQCVMPGNPTIPQRAWISTRTDAGPQE